MSKTVRLSMTVPGLALAVLLTVFLATACSSSAPGATLVTRIAGCAGVQTLTYSGAPGAQPAAATQCVPEASLITAADATAPQASSSSMQPGASTATATREIPTVGKLTFLVDGVLSLSCTATVIDGTAAKNSEELIVTAAHCLEGTFDGITYTSTHLLFSPMWHDGKNPFGTWTVKKAFLSKGWLTCKAHGVDCKTNPLDDYAVVVLNPKNGKGVGDLTGADGWAVNQPKTIDRVTIAGIPSTSPGTLVTTINTRTVTESGEPYRQAATPGFTDGTSGGPWLRDFSTKTNRGVLIGDTGGFEQGGPSSGTPSYSNYWTGGFAAVVKAAVSFEG
jgi:V8-like Glu-specific endopeptidase